MAFLIVLLVAGWLGLIALGMLAKAGPRDDLMTILAWRTCRLYCRLMHGLEVVGAEHLPREIHPGALIVVSNHSAGIDPLVIQASCPFFIRWLMAERMMLPRYRWVWDWAGVIPVSGSGRELASARSAIRALAAGEVVGIFPEGGIERPARTLMPFIAGVGLIIAKTKAPVLPVFVDGAPIASTAWGSLFRFSRTRLRVMPAICYAGSGMKPEEIAKDLEDRYRAWSGWPVAQG